MNFSWHWQARFKDGKVIVQPDDDKYSKHDDSKDFNPSSFRDFLDYFNKDRDNLESFGITNYKEDKVVVVRFDENEIRLFTYKKGDKDVVVKKKCEKLENAQPIYFRKMENTSVNGVFGTPKVVSYTIGFQGTDKNGKNAQYLLEVEP